MFKNKKTLYLVFAFIILLLISVLLFDTHLQEWLSWHISQFFGWVKVKLNPPEKVEFSAPKKSTPEPMLSTIAAMPSETRAVQETIPVQAENLASPNLDALPAFKKLEGVTYFSQHNRWNYCGPANLAMALSYWGWEGTHDDVAKVVKPYQKDKAVMPYELVDYVRTQTDLDALTRVGGDLYLLKKLISNGYPVVVEKGTYFRDINYRITWMGHYQLLTGYEEARSIFIAQDSYINANYEQDYAELINQWRSFNYTYLVVFPRHERNDVLNILGENSDEEKNYQLAAQKASAEIYTLQGIQQFFAWYNYGTNLVYLRDYHGAANAYDQAFAFYNQLPEDNTLRPYRILWYETGPYYAYYYMARYQDVIDLATNNSINMVRDDEPALEESYYWRAKAKIALGDQKGASDDLMTCLTYHPEFTPCVEELNALGIFP